MARTGGIVVRMGLHSGQANERGGDYFGPAVNRAARLIAAANGGQVICSRVTAELARAAVADIDFHDLGEVRLKDLLDPEIVYGVVAPGLGSTFPPLRTLDRARHNLPVQRTRLIGRDADVARVVELVHAHRLVTLTGIGGCGKTRLSLASRPNSATNSPMAPTSSNSPPSRIMMDWSWELLSAEEQQVLACLSVFSGGWTLEAAEGLCGRLGHRSVAAVLRSLVAKSLVEPRVGLHGNRYRLLETVRLFAQQKLVDLGRSMDARAAHFAWFAEWLDAVPIDQRVFSRACWDAFIAEFDNVSAAVDWAIDRQDFTVAVELVFSGAGVFLVGIGSGQAIRWVSLLLPEDLDNRTRARVLVTGVLAAVTVGAHEKIIPWAEEAAALSRDDEPIVFAVASTFHATPLAVRQPKLAAELLQVAQRAAVDAGLVLTKGFVDSFSLVALFCAAEPTESIVTLSDEARFGGTDSGAWSTAVTIGAIVEARLGRLDAALLLFGDSAIPRLDWPSAPRDMKHSW